jgi:hypothetical protein
MHAAAATEFQETFTTLGLTQTRIAELFNVTPRHVRRWYHGDRNVPHTIGLVVNLLAMGAVTVDQVAQAATASTPARTNGSTKPGPQAPRSVEPTPADPGLTTTRKVLALEPATCRWPDGDPRHPDFHFCGRPAAKGAYCEIHRRAACLAPRTGGGQGMTTVPAARPEARLAACSVL